MNLKRMIHIENRLMDSAERKYTRLILSALKEQAESYLNNGYLGNYMYPVIEKLYDDMFRFWMPRQYKQLERDTVKAATTDFFLPDWFRFMQELKLTTIATQVKGIDDVTESAVRDIITEGAKLGLTRGEIAAKVLAVTSKAVGKYRARMIARTELGQAVNLAKTKSAEDWRKASGNKLGKIWIHRGAKHPRDWHQYLDTGRAIPEESKWVVTDPNTLITDNMMFPHDPSASAGNVINCGCQVLYVRWKEQN